MPEAIRPAEQPPDVHLAIRVWNLMDGLDWAAMPVVFEMFGVTDPETMIVQLVAIRDHQKDKG